MDAKVTDNKWIGKRTIRPDGADKVTGRPMIDTVIVEIPDADHPHGVRGVGEVPIVPPMATVANAIQDAVGIRLDDLPMSPPKVLAALDKNS